MMTKYLCILYIIYIYIQAVGIKLMRHRTFILLVALYFYLFVVDTFARLG